MLLIHKSKRNYEFTKDGKEYKGYTCSAVFLDDTGYHIEKLTSAVFDANTPVGSKYRLLYDKYGRVAELVKGG